MILKIAIADTNEEYVKRILSVLEEYEDLNLSVFTDENTLEQALMSQKFDVLLLMPVRMTDMRTAEKGSFRFCCWMKRKVSHHNFKRLRKSVNTSGSAKFISRY